MDYSKSGSVMREVEMPPSRRDKMEPVAGWSSMKALARGLFRGTGFLEGLGLLLRSNTLDMARNKPEWHPEYFEFKDGEEEEAFKKSFDELTPMIILYNNLRERYGEYLADEISAHMAIPGLLAYYLRAIPIPEERGDIDRMRQMLSDFIANDRGYELKQWLSEDRTEIRMRWTKCAPAMILRAYGLHSYAGNLCLTDHVYFDCLLPEVIFSRTCAIGVGDSYCDHVFRYPIDEDDRKEESDYGDCYKVGFGGRDAVEHWKEVFRRYGEFRL